jgi:hypothetical protein
MIKHNLGMARANLYRELIEIIDAGELPDEEA